MEKWLSVEVTKHCNNACLHCFASADNIQKMSLPFYTAKNIMLEGYKKGYQNLHITGGEPLLWDDLFPMLDHAFDLGFKSVFLNTNGVLLTDQVSLRLSKYGNISISLSLDGPEFFHDRLRGKGSYTKTRQAIKRALDSGNDLIIFTTVGKTLLPILPDFADELFATFPNINYWTLIQLIRPNHGSFVLSEELLEPKDFLEMVRIVSLLNVYGLRVTVLNNPIVNLVSKFLEMPWVPPYPSVYGNGSIFIRADRNISLSHSSSQSFGKYKPGMIESVLKSDGYRKALDPDATVCPSCRYVKLCTDEGIFRPPEFCSKDSSRDPFCKRVFDLITN